MMSDLDEFEKVLRETDIFKQVSKSMLDEPLKLLVDICNKSILNDKPVPDHSLHIQGYIGDVALKTLIEAGLIEKLDGGRVSLYSYQPTESGTAFYKKIKSEFHTKD